MANCTPRVWPASCWRFPIATFRFCRKAGSKDFARRRAISPGFTMGFLSITSWPFAAAGAICACAPLIIHLLNRRRYRVVKWAAMDFLRQAVQQNRRILQIRDILLLVLRTAAVLLFG